ncbi:MAG: bifunctional hydroxymethylpyrimidine kinase/phosphomethylpyrimidine kinase [Prevotella sp.]|nr:bifunctional hydroxymethylpyrimidine kinase/phosphomethylpyrimidine kinase [Prevotella sp.]
MRYICALTIAGSDCSGGAGIQADIKTMSALGVYATTAITSITVQNTKGVQAVHGVGPIIVADQIKAVMDDIKPDAVKIGMVNDRATIQAIADMLKHYPKIPIVIDPIMMSTSGFNLMQPDALEPFCQTLIPMSTLLTPNLPEAEILSNMKIHTIEDMDIAAQRILNLSCKAVLIKGGHMKGDRKIDRLYMPNGSVQTFTHKRIDTRNTHGTGCTLSSAITSFIARGLDLADAITAAKNYLSQALEAGKDIYTGEGHGPVNHLFNPEKLITL